ncbi:MAG TPA: protein TolR [Nevskiaceae bacterium]|nr:protein TolR [Nevskiaceae bacterium]
MARRKLSSEINVVPYIDVMLVLLIIFMITAPLLTQGIAVDLPKVDAANISTSQEPTTVSVSAEGQFYINKSDDPHRAVDEPELAAIVKKLVEAKPDDLILVEADGQAHYEDVAKAMAILQTSGATKVGFVTKPADKKDL